MQNATRLTPPCSANQPQIRHIHAIWCAATGQQIKLGICDAFRERAWYDFIQAGFTEADILTVAGYLRQHIRTGSRNPGALKFSNMIAQLDRFDEDLQMAKAEARNTKPPITPLARVLEQARPTAVIVVPVETQNTAKPIGHYIQQLRDAAR